MMTRHRFAARMFWVAMAAMTVVMLMADAGTAAAAGRLQISPLDRCAATFAQRIVEAERLRAEAAAAGSEWLDTGALLSTAKDEAANGNMEAACSLLELAVFQAKMAIQQAEYEADAWSKRAVR